MVGVQEQLLQTLGVPHDVLGHVAEAAVPLVHVVHLAVASLQQRNTLEHDDH